MVSTNLVIITLASFALFGWSGYIFKKHNDEIPIIAALLNLCFIWHYFAIRLGIAEWVTTEYSIPIEFSDIWATKALYYILVGMYILIVSYHLFRRYRTSFKVDNNYYLKDFLQKNRLVIIVGLALSFLISNVFGSNAYITSGGGSSYILYLPLFTASTVVLGFLSVKIKAVSGSERFIVLILLLLNVSSTLVSNGRFALISWVTVLIILMTNPLKFRAKIFSLAFFSSLFLIFFTVLGMRRNPKFLALNVVEQFKLGFLNLAQFNDFNMVDGMTMLLQVIPRHLDYAFGMGHLEVLARPIPRALWPNKPVGGWQQKLAIAQAHHLYGDQASPQFFGTGISPTLFGDFYSEAGLVGIVLLCLLYGYLIAKLINISEQHASDVQLVIRGMLIAFIFPLIRGGDLPGVVAIALMSYWPLIYFIWSYRKFLRRKFSA